MKALFFSSIWKKFKKTLDFLNQDLQNFMYHSYSFHPQDEEDIIIKYVNGKGRVGIFIQSKDDNISSVVNEENLDFDDLEYQYWDDAQEVTVTNDQFFFSEKEIKRAVINTVAASFNKKGYSHPSVMWALWNMPGSTWVCPVSKENNYEEEKRKKEIRQRVESLKIKKMCQSLVNTFGETAVRKVTFTGSDGEDYGYMIYDLLTGTKCGVEVTCWGSEQYGGNCRCINHDPSHDIDQTEMSVEDIKKVEELLSKENNSGDEINTQTTKQDQDKSYYDKITVNDVKISIGWDQGYNEYTLYFPQIETNDMARKKGVSDQVLRISENPNHAKVFFDYTVRIAQTESDVYKVFLQVEKYLRNSVLM